MRPGAGIQFRPRNVPAKKAEPIPQKESLFGVLRKAEKEKSPKRPPPGRQPLADIPPGPRERKVQKPPVNRAAALEHNRLEKRLGTEGEGVPRILGVSKPIYDAFMKGDAVATLQVRQAAEQFKGNERDFCGPYTVKKVLAAGGFGEVSEVVNDNGKAFASKVFMSTESWGLPGEQKSLFYSSDAILEIDILSRVHHPNVLSARKVSDLRGRPEVSRNRKNDVCVIVDLGKPLDKALAEGYPRVKAAAEFMCGLRYLHVNRIIHRDIKDNNALVHEGVLKVIDFGLALNAEKIPVEIGGPAGTPGWIDPQIFVDVFQRRPAQWSYASDIYSAGLMMAFLLFGIDPWVFYKASKNTFYDPNKIVALITTLRREGFEVSDLQNKIAGVKTGPTRNFVETYADKRLLAENAQYKQMVMDMLSLVPSSRPTASQVVAFFEQNTGWTCERPMITYERSIINYREAYTKENRAKVLRIMTSKIPHIQLPMLACTSDILDRMCSLADPKHISDFESIYKWGFIAKYLALSSLGFGVAIGFENMVLEMPNDFPDFWRKHFRGSEFNKNLELVLKGLNYRVFRPTISAVMTLPETKAKEFIYNNLSPDYIDFSGGQVMKFEDVMEF